MKKLSIIFIITALASLNEGFSQWQPPVRLTNNSGQSATSFSNGRCIAAPGDTVHAVWYDDRDSNYDIYYKRSLNGGVTWGGDVQLTSQTKRSSDPSISVSGNYVHVIWDDMRAGNARIYYKRSTDGGTTWGPDVQLSESPDGANLSTIAVSGLNIHITWTDYRHAVNTIYYKRSTDGGTAWGPDVRLTNTPFEASHSSISAVLSNIHIVWQDSRDTENEVYYKRSTSGGLTWETDVRLSIFPLLPGILPSLLQVQKCTLYGRTGATGLNKYITNGHRITE